MCLTFYFINSNSKSGRIPCQWQCQFLLLHESHCKCESVHREGEEHLPVFVNERERGFKDTALYMMRDLVQFVQLKRMRNTSVERC